jgi:succinate dehydrogenase/fumarate reductase cytochrome b subunit
VSQSSDDALTGPIRGQAGLAGAQTNPGAPRAIGDPVRRWNTVRDLTAGVLLIVALFLPWNLYFGIGIPDSRTTLFALLGAVTLLSLLSLAVTFVGPWKSSGTGRLRLLLNVPYQLLVIAFIVFDVFQTIRSGGSVHVPGGVGPGAWLGVAGSLLAAQPVIAGSDAEPAAGGHRFRKWRRSAQIMGYASIFGASLSTAFHLCWRVRYALHDAGGSSGFGKQNIAVIATAAVYGTVALAAVLVASTWLLRSTTASQLATIALGASTLVAGILVWGLPVGRDIDAFHGIAQNTSTAGVGYEGYLAWAAGAAVFAPPALFGYRNTAPDDESPWRAAARKGLLLIAVWCLGSVLMRITDLAVAVALNYPYSRYDTVTLAAFDLATGVLAIWLRVHLTNNSASARLTSSLCGLLFTLGISRVVVGVVLAPRFQEPPNGGGWTNPVYGNNLAQQITSTFDVALCGLALGILAAAIISGRLTGRRAPGQRGQRSRKRRAAHTRAAKGPAPATAVPPSAAATTRIPTGPAREAPTAVLSRPAGSPRIFRGSGADDSATRQIQVPQIPKPKIYRPPQDST